ncbi:hypothetical protein L3Q82_007940 [Scortum barcoo]|uniref:Uncharacterized protein n=1 Tax=Scortum barcoo TaxID=214431 RepID=A0ACB8WNF1_9TELE|nr:hypothetical protein L3Q82_007940 [Scortum barcoo]
MAFCSSAEPPPPALIIRHHLKLFDRQTFAEPIPKSAFVCLCDSLVIRQKNGICLVTYPEIRGEKRKKKKNTQAFYRQGRRESLPVVHQAVRRRFSGPLLLPPLWRRHSCQDHPGRTRRTSGVHGLPLDRLEELYSQALASHDEHRTRLVDSSASTCSARRSQSVKALWHELSSSDSQSFPFRSSVDR